MEDAALALVRDAWVHISPEFPGVEARFRLDGPTSIVAYFRDRDGNEAGCAIRRSLIGASKNPRWEVGMDLREGLACLGNPGQG